MLSVLRITDSESPWYLQNCLMGTSDKFWWLKCTFDFRQMLKRVASNILTGLKLITMCRINVENYAFCSHVATCTKKTLRNNLKKPKMFMRATFLFNCLRKSYSYFYWAWQIILYNSSTEHEQWCYAIPFLSMNNNVIQFLYLAWKIMLYNSCTGHEKWCYIIAIALVIFYHKVVPVLKE